MIELINPATIGILAGLVSGCIPGIGNFAALLILFPYLINLIKVFLVILVVLLWTQEMLPLPYHRAVCDHNS